MTAQLCSMRLGCSARSGGGEGLLRSSPRLAASRRARTGAPVTVLNYRPEKQQQQQQERSRSTPPQQNRSPQVADQQAVSYPTDPARASADELQRSVRQLQADNAELQAEIQVLAASLRAALETGSASLSAQLFEQQQGVPGSAQQGASAGADSSARAERQQYHQLEQHFAEQQQQRGDAPHTHNGVNGGNNGSWQGSSDVGSLLSSVDTLGGGDGGPGAVPPYHLPTSVSHATLSCSMQHPGSICCSKLSSAMDPGGAACTISLHTTARCTADEATVHRHLQPEELRALAAHALVGAAHAFSQAATKEYRAKSAPPQDVAAAHAELVHCLEHGVVIHAERTPHDSQFDHKSYLLTLQDPDSARRVRAIYKPRVYGDAGGWHRTPMEWVAYRLNLLLGLDYVPPTAYRSAPLTLSLGDEDEDLVFQEGAMMLWVENCNQLNNFHEDQWGVDPAVLLSDTRVLDVLLHNSDRHHGHFLLGPHWARGHSHAGHWQGQMLPVLIDHAAAFRKEAVVSMEHENAFSTGPVRCVSASTYLRLRFLDSHTIAEELGMHLSRSEQRQLLHRRDYVLHYFDELVASQGYSATVRE